MKYFVFRNEGIGIYRIPLLEGNFDEEDILWGDMGELLNEECEPLEHAFGIHDWSTSGDEELIGYTSYEIDDDKWPELIELWRQILVKLGYKIGKTEYEGKGT